MLRLLPLSYLIKRTLSSKILICIKNKSSQSVEITSILNYRLIIIEHVSHLCLFEIPTSNNELGLCTRVNSNSNLLAHFKIGQAII